MLTENIGDEEKEQREKELETAMEILLTLHPDDYKPFFNKRETRQRKLHTITFDQEQ